MNDDSEQPGNDFPPLIPPLTRWERSKDWAQFVRRIRGIAAVILRTDPLTCVLWGGALATVTALVVVTYYLNHPHVDTSPDTTSYLRVAHDILTSGQLVHTDRTPGYPILLALFNLLTGSDNPGLVSVIQGAFYVVATIQTYLVGLLLLRRAWAAFLIGLLLGVDVSQLAFIKPVLSESLALLECTSLILAVVLFVRGTRILTLWIVTVIMLAAFMTRPELIYLPVPLFGYLMVVAARRGRLLDLLPHAIAGLILLYAVLGSYIQVNATQNDFAGVTEIQNINLLGKVMQYHMQTEAPPEYAAVAQTVDAYVTQGAHDPFVILDDEPVYQQHHYALLGAYATAVIEGHPLQFAADTLPVMFTSQMVFDNPESQIDPQGPFAGPLLRLQTIFVRGLHLWYGSFVFLAVLALALALWMRPIQPRWRRPMEMMGAVALLGLYGLVITSVGSYDSYARLHAPYDTFIALVSWGGLIVGIRIGVPRLWAWYKQTGDTEQAVSSYVSPQPLTAAALATNEQDPANSSM